MSRNNDKNNQGRRKELRPDRLDPCCSKNVFRNIFDDEVEVPEQAPKSSRSSLPHRLLFDHKNVKNQMQPNKGGKRSNLGSSCLNKNEIDNVGAGIVISDEKENIEAPRSKNVKKTVPLAGNLFEAGIRLPRNWVSHNTRQELWNTLITIVEPVKPGCIPQYDKFLLYPNSRTEISPEELRAFKWFKRHKIKSPVTEEYERVWCNDYESGARIPPGFVNRNEKQIFEQTKTEDLQAELQLNCQTDNCKLQTPLEKLHPLNCEVLSVEELLAEKFVRGEIKILTEESFESFENMNTDDSLINQLNNAFDNGDIFDLFRELNTEQQEDNSYMEARNCYESSINKKESKSTSSLRKAIQDSEGNPFKPQLHKAMLEHCKFSRYLKEHVQSCDLQTKVPKLQAGTVLHFGSKEYCVMNFIASGSFGSIFTVKSKSTGIVMAVKQQKPANLWEYYINIKLFERFKNKEMIAAFVRFKHAIITDDLSLFMMPFSTYGTILDVCNRHKIATNRKVDECIVMVLTTQLLSIIDHLHNCKIIHADIKPDNFLLISKLEFGMKSSALQLIDFGTAIDMNFYEKGQTFQSVVQTKNFTCCEMLEGKPWTYQTDLFGIAGTSHVMLFGKYMEVKKAETWEIKSRFPRYFNKSLWETFYNALLNVPDCDTMPNLQALRKQFEEEIHNKKKLVCNKIAKFNQIISK